MLLNQTNAECDGCSLIWRGTELRLKIHNSDLNYNDMLQLVNLRCSFGLTQVDERTRGISRLYAQVAAPR